MGVALCKLEMDIVAWICTKKIKDGALRAFEQRNIIALKSGCGS